MRTLLQFWISSTGKGFLPPRKTSTQRNAIVSPATGLTVFCSDCGDSLELKVYVSVAWTKAGVAPGTAQGQMQYWNGTKWVLIASDTEGQTLMYTNGVPSWSN